MAEGTLLPGKGRPGEGPLATAERENGAPFLHRKLRRGQGAQSWSQLSFDKVLLMFGGQKSRFSGQ